MGLRERQHEDTAKKGPKVNFGGGASEEVGKAQKNCMISHGILMVEAPVEGMTIGQIRKEFAKKLNIDPEASGVVNSEVVDDSYVVGEGTLLLSFVKQAAMKGMSPAAPVNEVVITGKEVTVPGPLGFKKSVTALGAAFARTHVEGLQQEALPPGCLWRVHQDNVTLYILQMDPSLRLLRLARSGYGKSAHYENLRLATPYVILSVPFIGQTIYTGGCELFYSNMPVRNLNHELLLSNLLNVSPNAYGCVAWFCTQYLNSAMTDAPANGKQYTHLEWLQALVKHLWDSGMNRSSEANEGQSCFSLSQSKNIDPRVTDFDRWQQCSVEYPLFVTEVNWLPTGVTIGQLIETWLKRLNKRRTIDSAANLATALQAETVL